MNILNNCQILGNISLALDVNHTLSETEHKNELVKIKINLNKILNNLKFL